MKTFIINGSPRKNGETSALIDRLVTNLEGEVKIFSTYQDQISPCTDCRYCRTHKGCSIQDKMQEIYECIETYDNVIIASPIYFMNLTPPMLAILSRFQAFYSDIYKKIPVYGKRKNGTVILTGGGSGGGLAAEKTGNLMLRMMNAEQLGTISSLKTDELPAKDDVVVLKQVDEITKKMNELCKKE